ncbi:MAG TPA: enhanced serine sensitivity protein SseB C-terminal domain-containing protein [Polyangiaceae bacterium]|nr:enhanced serine sensitivity protein SseB C-terminal domain-containing protein [Polyangiaceae bacterium]
MSDSTGNGSANPADLTNAVLTARRGLRRDVQVLIDALEQGELLVPLAEPIPEAAHGERVELEGEMKIVPHVLLDPEGHVYCTAFTRGELIGPVADALSWTTASEELEYCVLPAPVALDMALQVIDEQVVLGLVLNPTAPSELLLRRSELASILQRTALPLVGYVREIPAQEDERTLIAEPADPPPPELVEAIAAVVEAAPEVTSFVLRRTFNAERDLEPHLTLSLRLADADADRQALTERITGVVEDKLPPPGYIDILFDDDT